MSDVGREIVEAAEAEIAKRYSQTPRLHWRREHLVYAIAPTHTQRQHTDSELRPGTTVVASACGRLVDYQKASGDPEKTDCRECAEVYFVVNPPPWVHGGV